MPEDLLRHPDGVLVEDVGDAVVLFVPEPEALHLLDGPAALVWRLAEARTMRGVYDILVRTFPDVSTLRDDVEKTVTDMLGRGLLATQDHSPRLR